MVDLLLGQATNPNPTNGATGLGPTPSLSWTAGSGATSHDVYFGTSNPPSFVQNQVGTTYSPSTLTVATPYYWRVDEKDSNGTTTGTVWSFTTAVATPPTNLLANPSFETGSGYPTDWITMIGGNSGVTFTYRTDGVMLDLGI